MITLHLNLCHTKLLLAFVLATAVWLSGADAQAQQQTYTPTPSHDFALAYHKLAGSTPDFRALAKNMQTYKDANEREEPEVMDRISRRLRTRFNKMDAHQKLLTVRTSMRMDVLRHPKKDKASLKLKLPGDRPLYFPMQPGARKIAIIMQDFKRFREIPLDSLEANYVDSRASDDEDIVMYLQLQPVEADAKTPLKLDGVAQWPLLTRIARMGLYNDENETIWEYKAPWFTTEKGNEVRGLFRK